MNTIKTINDFLYEYRAIISILCTIAAIILILLFLNIRTDSASTVNEPAKSLATHASQSGVMGVQSPNQRDETLASSSSVIEEDDSVMEDQENSDPAEAVEEVPADLDSVKVQADAAIVWDVENEVPLYEKNIDKEMPLASITKLMTALVAVESPEYTHDEEIMITRQHLDAYGNSGLVAGQKWNIRDLISFMLMSSANDAARAVASLGSDREADGYYTKAFIEDMNDKARNLGLDTTYFFNPSGLDLNETLISGGYGNAEDVARLFSYLLQNNRGLLEPTTVPSRVFQSTEGTTFSSINTNNRLSRFSNILGSKTGYTVLAGGNLVMGFELQRPVVIVVLGSSRTGRFSDMETLYQATKQELSSNKDISNPHQ